MQLTYTQIYQKLYDILSKKGVAKEQSGAIGRDHYQ